MTARRFLGEVTRAAADAIREGADAKKNPAADAETPALALNPAQPGFKDEVKKIAAATKTTYEPQLVPWDVLIVAIVSGLLVHAQGPSFGNVLLIPLAAVTFRLVTEWRLSWRATGRGRFQWTQPAGRRKRRIAKRARRATWCGAVLGVWLNFVALVDANTPIGLIVWIAGAVAWALISHEGWWLPAENKVAIHPSPRPLRAADDTDDGHEDDDTVVQTFAPAAQPADRPPVPRRVRERAAAASQYAAPARVVVEPVPSLPPSTLLNRSPVTTVASHVDFGPQLQAKFDALGVDAKVLDDPLRGPRTTRYSVVPGPKTSIKRLRGLKGDIDFICGGDTILHSPLPGRQEFGIEVPNLEFDMITLIEVMSAQQLKNDPNPLLVPLGKDADGRYLVVDIGKLPHLLIAGATGGGKSGALNEIICSVLLRGLPKDVRFVFIDLKRVELTPYQGIPHLLFPVITDLDRAANVLEWLEKEMTDRYDEFAANGVRNITEYNKKVAAGQIKPNPATGEAKTMHRIVAIIDELAELMLKLKEEVEPRIISLLQLARAAGIHLILATQRPSVDVITGLIKANLTARLAFRTASNTDSRVILDRNGAESLLGEGDALYSAVGASSPRRLQTAWVDEKEIAAIVDHWVNQVVGALEMPVFDINKPRVNDNDDEDGPKPHNTGSNGMPAHVEVLSACRRLADDEGLVSKETLDAATPDMLDGTRSAALTRCYRAGTLEKVRNGLYRVLPPNGQDATIDEEEDD